MIGSSALKCRWMFNALYKNLHTIIIIIINYVMILGVSTHHQSQNMTTLPLSLDPHENALPLVLKLSPNQFTLMLHLVKRDLKA